VWYKNIAGMFFGFVTKHACDRQADGRTDKIALAASIAESRGKNRDAQNKRSVIKSVESVLGPEDL